MNWSRPRTFAMLFGLMGFLVAGCGGGGPKLGQVSGKVTFDGQPLAGATVVFEPAEDRGSAGVTDGQGNYELGFVGEEMGAVLGKHTVRVIAATEDAEGKALPNPVRLPDKYNENSELTAEVKAGPNEFNFDL